MKAFYKKLKDLGWILDSQIKGAYVWNHEFQRMVDLFESILKKFIEKENFKKVKFPIFGLKKDLEKEKKFLNSFFNESFSVENSFFLRPTGEPVMYPFFSRKFEHISFPNKLYQISYAYRKETKNTRKLFREREIRFVELHSIQTNPEKNFSNYLNIIDNFFSFFGIPYLIHERPFWDRFPGAFFSWGVDVPINKKILQVASYHDYKDNFSKLYFLKKNQKFLFQTTFGITTRFLGFILSSYFFKNSFVLPSSLSIWKGIILKIGFFPDLLFNSEFFFQESISERDLGKRIYYWKERGIPLIGIYGRKEIKEKKISFLINSIKEEKVFFKINSELEDKIEEVLKIRDKILKEVVRKKIEKKIFSLNFQYLCIDCSQKIPSLIGFQKKFIKICEICNKSTGFKWTIAKKI